MTQPKLTDSSSPNHVLTIEELWNTLAYCCNNRCYDNQKYEGEYPLETRIQQMDDLRMLISEIEKFHKIFSEKSKKGEKNETYYT